MCLKLLAILYLQCFYGSNLISDSVHMHVVMRYQWTLRSSIAEKINVNRSSQRSIYRCPGENKYFGHR